MDKRRKDKIPDEDINAMVIDVAEFMLRDASYVQIKNACRAAGYCDIHQDTIDRVYDTIVNLTYVETDGVADG